MDKKTKQKDYLINLDSKDLYWIQTLLYDYIESNNSNFHQKIEVLKTFVKTINVGNFHPYLDKDDIKNIKELKQEGGNSSQP